VDPNTNQTSFLFIYFFVSFISKRVEVSLQKTSFMPTKPLQANLFMRKT